MTRGYQMGPNGARFNRRSEYFAQSYQHLVNHGSQRLVNHAAQSGASYQRLTANIKRIPTPFRHDRCTTGPISPAWESSEASNAKWRNGRRVEPRIAARPRPPPRAPCRGPELEGPVPERE